MQSYIKLSGSRLVKFMAFRVDFYYRLRLLYRMHHNINVSFEIDSKSFTCNIRSNKRRQATRLWNNLEFCAIKASFLDSAGFVLTAIVTLVNDRGKDKVNLDFDSILI